METNTNTFSSSFENGDFEAVLKSFRTLTREQQIVTLYPLLSPDKGLKVLHKYFLKPNNADPFWIDLFAHTDYTLLISAIRVNRAFLNSHFDSLLPLADHKELYVRRHYIAFCQLRKYELELLETASQGATTMPQTSCEEWLWHIAFWMEFNKAYMWVKDPSGLEHPKWQQHLVWASNHFLSDLFVRRSGHLSALSDNESKELAGRIFSYYETRINESTSSIYFQVLDSWYQWYTFTVTCLDTYCFDLNFEVLTKDNKLVFFADEVSKFFRWKDNGEKQQVWLSEQVELSLKQSYTDNIQSITEPAPFSVDHEIRRRGLEARLVADFYYLHPAADFPLEELLNTWHRITGSALADYVVPLDNIHQATLPERWVTNVLETCKIGDTKPVLSVGIDYLRNIVKNETSPNTNKKEVFEFIKRRLVQLPELLKPENYNRFNPYINFFSKPLLALGNRIYYLPAIIGETSTGIGLVENLLAQLSYAQQKFEDKRQPERIRNRHAPLAKVAMAQAHKMEEVIAGRFVKAGFKNVVCSKKYGIQKGATEGELDCLVYESGVLLIIEIKRTQLRLTLEEAWNEKMMILGKAAEQLDRGINFIRESFWWLQGVFPEMKESFSELDIKTLIVSTSFEHDHELINDGHLKVSLYEFDKLQEHTIIENARKLNQNPVNQFYNTLLNNNFWENLPKHVLKEKPILELPLK